ncbi:GTPase Era [Parvularcula flava]|uniref:GTPase Era n=1 Tax=Aquisalinus luteolus TaxID=1566827 RepID=A0A8J3A5Z5_9PROT|nr:GTPase Era [Aquisalinus luteolus]NHK27564.1 GTPase Era [Aquisalinus luteolus]GGH95817.1 GTPase Era [Aquisalinus luteolus]
MTEETTHCGFVTVLGAPNAGKSTLVNQMVGAKVSIVTHKVQTTRARVRGVAVQGQTQIVYTDTPGIFLPRRKLDEAMVSAAWEGNEGADVTLLMVDAPAYYENLKGDAKGAARKAAADTDRIVEGLKAAGVKAILVLNKIDLMPSDHLLSITAALNEAADFTETFMISAEKRRGLDGLRDYLVSRMPEGPWMYPEDQLSDISDRLMAAEVTREKLFLRLHQELPYALTVETESWKEQKGGDIRIEQVIYVERDGQKKLVLGAGGHTIKAVGQAAREELQQMLDVKVHLFLFVKVRENWSSDPARFREMGLEAPKG